MLISNNYPQELLTALMEMEIRESYVRLELLDWNENFLQEIQGIVTTGSVSIDGKSSMRRTCNFTMILPDGQDEYELSNIINLNKKFNLYIGYKNNLKAYQNYGEVLWFKLGVFVFISVNFTHSTSSTQISVTARDKMCLLNGQVQGTIPEAVILHDRELDDGTLQPIPIREIIYELVHHYGKEPISNIFINGVPDYGRLLVKYIGTRTMYLQKNGDNYTGAYLFDSPGEWTNYDMKVTNDLIGYRKVNFIYPGELISKVGDSVVSILDNICNTFGNFEYFYDVDGHFIFQEKQNYLNTSYKNYVNELDDDNYKTSYGSGYIAYSFKDKQIISSYTNTPKWENIKNDFVVWGTHTTPSGLEIPIHYHLAIDSKPTEEYDENGNPIVDYRQLMYERDVLSKAGESAASDYYKELAAFWPQIYTQQAEIDANPNVNLIKGFKDYVKNDPLSLKYWLEILDDKGKYAKYSVSSIGRRTYAIEDKDAIYIYPPSPPSIVWTEKQDEVKSEIKDIEIFNGYICALMPAELSSAIVAAADGKSCFEVIREALYQHLSLQETITVQSLPIYWLEPNVMIEVEDEKSNIFGNYIISTMNIPLTYNGLMSLTAIRADTRI